MPAQHTCENLTVAALKNAPGKQAKASTNIPGHSHPNFWPDSGPTRSGHKAASLRNIPEYLGSSLGTVADLKPDPRAPKPHPQVPPRNTCTPQSVHHAYHHHISQSISQDACRIP